MAGRSVYITENEAEAIWDAIDFIGTNADGADEREPFDEMQKRLNDVYEKYGKAKGRRAR